MGSAWKLRLEALNLSSEDMGWIQENFEPALYGKGSGMYSLVMENLPESTPPRVMSLVRENSGVLDVQIVW